MYNKIVTIGHLTRDIEIKYLPNNTPIAKGAIATSHRYKGSDGVQKDETCFLDFTIFGRIAEVANKYLHKGSKVMLEGRLQFDQWTDNQTGAKRSKHSLLVNELKMLDSKGDSNGYQNQGIQNNLDGQNQQYKPQTQQQYQNSNNTPVIDVDEIPDDPNDWKVPTIDIKNGDIPF